jgi:hypothetical protein
MLGGANTSALVLAQAVDSFSRSEQRWEFANTAAAVALLSVALAAIVLFCFRPRTRDLTLIYFSLFCILYAVRLICRPVGLSSTGRRRFGATSPGSSRVYSFFPAACSFTKSLARRIQYTARGWRNQMNRSGMRALGI